MDDLVAAIDVVLARVQAQAVGEFVRVIDVDDWLLDLRAIAGQRELEPA